MLWAWSPMTAVSELGGGYYDDSGPDALMYNSASAPRHAATVALKGQHPELATVAVMNRQFQCLCLVPSTTGSYNSKAIPLISKQSSLSLENDAMPMLTLIHANSDSS